MGRNITRVRDGRRLSRAALFTSTALSAAALAGPAAAQTIDPGTTPQGGVVVGGSAAIVQAPGTTTINQASERTSINWQSFDVGAAAQVRFNQPNAQAIALNRVTGGNLSIINGRIDANGQVVLVNQSGVVFAKGSQVNAENIVVSTSNITDKNFMAGHMVFDGAPNPGARIINDGQLTAKGAGLVGLVAPQVSNSGVITASLGEVVLAGASAFTLDLYGDKLISLDVTQAVRGIDLNGQVVPALVTNSGIIVANGGQITLTAQQADALVTQLINAGGTIQADSAGGQAGRIALNGVGGEIAIAGNLLARGTAPGAVGGGIEVVSTGNVAVAAGAVVDASGAAGGGAVALGTDLARAARGAADVSAPKAAAVQVAAGAVVRADATTRGHGGKIVLLSRSETDFQGSASVRGGPQGGDGGLVEISSDGVISLGGTVLATAIGGQAGEVLLDPSILYIGDLGGTLDNGHGATTFGNTLAGPASFILPSQLASLSGKVLLEAHDLISVASAIDMANPSRLSLISLGDISITAGIIVNGSLELDAGNSLAIQAGLDADEITLNGGTAGTSIDAPVTAGTLVALGGGGTITEGSFLSGGTFEMTGVLDAPTLTSGGGTIGGDVLLTNTNTIGTLGGFVVAAGQTLNLNATGGTLTVAGPVVADTARLSATTLDLAGEVDAATALTLGAGQIRQTAGTIGTGLLTSAGTLLGDASLTAAGNNITDLGDFAVDGNLAIRDGAGLTVTGLVQAPFGEIDLSGTTLAESGAGAVQAAVLSTGGGSFSGGATLGGNANIIATLGGFGAASLLLTDAEGLEVGGLVKSAGVVTLNDRGGNVAEDADGTIQAASFGGTVADNVSLTNVNTIAAIDGLTLGALGTLTLVDAGTLGIGDVQAFDAEIDAAAISITGTLAVTNDLGFEGAGLIDETTGVIDAGILTSLGTITGDVLLNNGNAITALSGFKASGDFLLNDATPLIINSGVTAANVGIAAPTLTVSATVDAAGQQVGQGAAAGTLALAADVINTGSIQGIPLAHLLAPGGTIEIAPFTDGRGIDLGGVAAGQLDPSPFLIAALDTAAAEIEFGTALGRQAGAITLDGSSSFGSQLLDLRPNGTINDIGTLIADTLAFGGGGFFQAAGGELVVSELQGDGAAVTGAVRLGNTANEIGELGSVSVTGADFTLATDQDMFVLGPVTATNVSLESLLGLEIGGAVSAGSGGTIDLVADTINSFSGAALSAPGGRVALAPYDNIGVDFGGFSGGLHIDAGFGTLVTAQVLQIGSAAGFTGRQLNVDGPLTIGAPTLALDGTSITFSGSLDEPGLVAFTSAGNVVENNGAAITAGTVAGSGGAIALTGGNRIGQLGSLISGGGIAVNDLIAMDVAGLLSAPGIITLTDPVSIAESTGTVDAGTLSASGPAGAISLGNLNSVNVIASLQAGGDILFDDALDVVIAGLIDTPLNVTLEDAGGISEGNGRIIAGTLNSGGTAIGGGVALNNANQIGTLGGFTVAAGHALSLHDVNGLEVAGPVLADNATLAAAALTIAGTIDIANALSLESPGNIAETTGEISAGELDSGGGVIGGGVTLNNGNNSIATLGGFDAAGGFALHDQHPLDIAAPVSLGGTLALLDSGSITQTGGSIIAAALTSDGGTVGGAVSLLGFDNDIPVLGGFAAIGGLALEDAAGLDLTGDIFTGTNALDLFVGGNGIVQTGGVIVAATLNAAAPAISLPDANAIGRIGSVTTGDILVNGVSGLAGPLVASNATLNAPGNFTIAGPARVAGALLIGSGGTIDQLAGSGPVTASTATYTAAGGITLAGSTDIANLFDLAARGNVIHGAGALEAGTLTGTAGSLASFTGPTDVGTLGSFLMQDSLFILDDDTALTIAGPVRASAMSISAVGLMTLQGSADGGLFFTGSIAPKTTTKPRPQDSVLTVTRAAGGGQPRLVQTGVFYINAGPNAKTYLAGKTAPATLFINTTPNGSISFAPAPPTTAGLDAPTIDLEIAAGAGGTIAGNVNLRQVVILSAGRVDLTGFLNNVGGPSGAGNGFVTPFPEPNFQFNACPIGSVNCTILPIESLPSADPLQSFDIVEEKKRKLNRNVQLPGIATRDF